MLKNNFVSLSFQSLLSVLLNVKTLMTNHCYMNALKHVFICFIIPMIVIMVKFCFSVLINTFNSFMPPYLGGFFVWGFLSTFLNGIHICNLLFYINLTQKYLIKLVTWIIKNQRRKENVANGIFNLFIVLLLRLIFKTLLLQK